MGKQMDKLNGDDNGKWLWNLMDEQMDFYNGNEWKVNLEMKMDMLMGMNLENDLIITNGYWIMNDEQKLITLVEQTLNNNRIQNNFDNEKRV